MVENVLELPVFKGGKGTVQIKTGLPELGEGHAPAGCGCFRVMTEKDGDKRYSWDRHDFAQIQEAKAFFDKCVAEGLVPHRVGVDGRASAEIMVEFDPLAEEIIFVPVAMVAGG